MVLTELALFTLCTGLTFTFLGPVKHPFVKTMFCLVIAIVASLPILVDTRLSIVPVVLAGAVLVYRNSYTAIPPLTCALIFSMALIVSPHANDYLYLEMRYTDHFHYIEEGMYYAENIDKIITVSRRYGDTYQSALYEKYIINMTLGHTSHLCKVTNIYVEETQTKILFNSVEEFVAVTDPIVHITVQVPSGVTFDETRLPYTTVVTYSLWED